MVAALLGSVVALATDPPQWWADRNVLYVNDPAHPVQDNAAANQGQLRHMASKAAQEFEEKLSGLDLSAVTAMKAFIEDPARNPNDFAAVNLGQLKYVAKPFYDVLNINNLQAAWPDGMTVSPYPWSGSANAQDNALANIGQLKYIFSFDVDAVALDSDGDGLPDWWELRYGLDPLNSVGDNGANGDPDRDSYTNAEERANGTNPRVPDGVRLLYAQNFNDTSVFPLNSPLTGRDSWCVDIQKRNFVTITADPAGGSGGVVKSELISSGWFRRDINATGATEVQGNFKLYFSDTGVFPPQVPNQSASSLLYYDPLNGLMAYDGSGAGSWKVVPDSLLTGQWVDIAVKLDYANKRWDVSISGHGSLTGLHFKDNNVNLTQFLIGQDSSSGGDLYLDDVVVVKRD
jgi:hypothetical protein